MGINETRYQVESVRVYRERSFGRARLIILANPLDSVAFDEDRSIWKETPPLHIDDGYGGDALGIF
jgi:hypothetical protein